ncbi:lysophosphatidic acid receptor 3-like [Acropora millepora]|uniref:lysophosphatidic acid receptor 3-like n=1 Tax=Acropora millepora TaxID=45264 RepID=UPI001CF4E310|nr:lysophosphatidic acid receptor 3-like [Acropora millepora]
MANNSQQKINTSSNSTRTCSSEWIARLTVFGIEAVAIVMLNALTIIVYLKERSLRKRSMYLVINQAVADMFVGAGLIFDWLLVGHMCELWTINLVGPLLDVLWTVSPLASLINLGAISLERTHATFRPFKHRLIKKKVFGAAAAIVWIAAGVISAGPLLEQIFDPPDLEGRPIFYISYLSSSLFCLLTIIVSYSSMAIKIVYGIQPHHRSATIRGRKLTKTLFIVTVVSLLLTLPFIITMFCEILQLCTSITLDLSLNLSLFMFYANSLVNPVLYTFRMPEFKRALLSILHCRSQQQPAPGFPLNEM